MKQLLSALLILTTSALNAQEIDTRSKNFRETFTLLYNSAAHQFNEVKGAPIISTMFGKPDTIGFRIRLLPDGVTDWKHISGSNSEQQTVFFKLGEYTTDSTKMFQRFNDVISLIKEIDRSVLVQYDDSYSDTKIKEVNICSGSPLNCGEDDPWRVNLYLHRFNGNEFGVSVNINSAIN